MAHKLALLVAVLVTLAAAYCTAASAQPLECAVRHGAFVEGSVAQGQMHVVNNGKPCTFSFKLGGTFEPSDWKVETAPTHGRVEATGSTVKYVPDADYAGPDAFKVAVFGFNPMLGHGHRSRNGRFEIAVVVRAAK